MIAQIDHPDYYGGTIEVINFIEDHGLGFHLGNVVKYVSRAGKKDKETELEDLQKAQWYLNRYIDFRGVQKKKMISEEDIKDDLRLDNLADFLRKAEEKDEENELEDLQKAKFYLDMYIDSKKKEKHSPSELSLLRNGGGA